MKEREVIGCEVCHRSIFKEHGPICVFCSGLKAEEPKVDEPKVEVDELIPSDEIVAVEIVEELEEKPKRR